MRVLVILSLIIPVYSFDSLQSNLHLHVRALTETDAPRSYENRSSLDQAGKYIEKQFSKHHPTEKQIFKTKAGKYYNVLSHLDRQAKKTIIIGAHFDVAGEQPGADDNASAVAGMLELARLLKLSNKYISYDIEFAAYTLEEPPFFAGKDMGSAHHARHHKKIKTDIELMICLEMVGYFTDDPNSQLYPTEEMKHVFPSVGNFIAVIGNVQSANHVHAIHDVYDNYLDLPTVKLASTNMVTGIDFSDHRNFWELNFNAVMITDTAFFRNSNYHTKSDTIDTLDFKKMAEVVKGVFYYILSL